MYNTQFMEATKDMLLQRTSIRRYTRQPIEPEKLDYIYEAIRNTSTSYNGQQFSVIAVTDQELKEQLYAITGQKQIKTCALFLVFCTDYHKIERLTRLKGVSMPKAQDSIEGYTVGVLDCGLAMQTAMVAAMSVGLGTCCIGYTRTADPQKTSALLNLPQGVSIVCGLTVGYPNEQPDLKPKEPLSLVVHGNSYQTENMDEELMRYDDVISAYNKTRSGTTSDNDWAAHVAEYYQHVVEIDSKKYLDSQGYHIK